MFGTLGGSELLLIFVIALIVFGPRKLPDIGKSLGKMLGEFRRASADFKQTIENEVEADKLRSMVSDATRIDDPFGGATPSAVITAATADLGSAASSAAAEPAAVAVAATVAEATVAVGSLEATPAATTGEAAADADAAAPVAAPAGNETSVSASTVAAATAVAPSREPTEAMTDWTGEPDLSRSTPPVQDASVPATDSADPTPGRPE